MAFCVKLLSFDNKFGTVMVEIKKKLHMVAADV